MKTRVTKTGHGTDLAWQGMSSAHVLLLLTALFQNWLLPATRAEHGEKGEEALHALWEGKDEQLFTELGDVAKMREQPATFALVTLTSFPHVEQVLKAGVAAACVLPWADRGESQALARKSKLEADWAEYMKLVEKDENHFNDACKVLGDVRKKQQLWNLAEARKLSEAGTAAMKDYLALRYVFPDAATKTYLQAGATWSKYVGDVAKVAGAGGLVPSLIIWDLNSLGNQHRDLTTGWMEIAAAFKELIVGQPLVTMGIILHRRTVQAMSRRKFHEAIAAKLESGGLDVDTDVALIFNKASSQNKQSLLQGGWLVFHQGSKDSNCWCTSALVMEATAMELEMPKYGEMVAPLDPSTVGVEGMPDTGGRVGRARQGQKGRQAGQAGGMVWFGKRVRWGGVGQIRGRMGQWVRVTE